MSSKLPYIISNTKKFWQPVTLIDNEGNFVDLSAPSEVKISGTTGNIAEVNESGQLKVVLDGKISNQNTTIIPLLANESFVGTSVLTLDYAEIYVAVFSDVASATNGLILEKSLDGINWLWNDNFTINANTGKEFSLQTGVYFRIRYVNGNTNQTNFTLISVLRKTRAKPSSHKIQDQIITEDDAELSKSVLTAQNPQGFFDNIKSNTFGNLLVSLEEQKDAFGRLKVSDPYTVSDNSLVSEYSKNLFWSQKLIGGATVVYDKATSKQILSVLSNNDIAIVQTKTRNHYQPYKSQEAVQTFTASKQAGVIKYIGYFDVDNYTNPTIDGTIYNGICLKIEENAVTFEIWNNGVLTGTAEQNNWNIDKLNGLGFSRITLDLNYSQIAFCQVEWLGVGSVIVGLNITGVNIPVHAFHHSNYLVSDVYMRTAKLPICYMIKSIGGAGSLKQICNSVISGGGFNPKGVSRSVNTTNAIAISANVTELLIGIRLKVADFDITLLQESLSVISIGKTDFLVRLCINPVYSQTVTWVNVTNSSIQYALNNNNVVSDTGIVLLSDWIAGENSGFEKIIDNSFRIGKGLNNDLDELWLVVTPSTNDSFQGTLNYRELI